MQIQGVIKFGGFNVPDPSKIGDFEGLGDETKSKKGGSSYSQR
jgi:hypothetical protein